MRSQPPPPPPPSPLLSTPPRARPPALKLGPRETMRTRPRTRSRTGNEPAAAEKGDASKLLLHK